MSAAACQYERPAADLMAGDYAQIDGHWTTVEHVDLVGSCVEIVLPDNTGVTFAPTAMIPVSEEISA